MCERCSVAGLPSTRRWVYRDLTLEPIQRSAWRGQRQVELTERETALLELLIRNAGAVVSRAYALREVWGDGDGRGKRRRSR